MTTGPRERSTAFMRAVVPSGVDRGGMRVAQPTQARHVVIRDSDGIQHLWE